jgi:hypothetical protein
MAYFLPTLISLKHELSPASGGCQALRCPPQHQLAQEGEMGRTQLSTSSLLTTAE